MIPRVRRCSIYCLLLLIGFLLSNPDAGGRVLTFAFTGLEANGIDAYDATVYSQNLHKLINAAGVYSAIPFSDVTLRLGEQGISGSCSNVECAVIAGQILGCDYFGIGSIGSVGKKTYTISMQVIEVRTGRVVRDVTEFFKGKKSGFEETVIPQFALKISGIEIQEGWKKR